MISDDLMDIFIAQQVSPIAVVKPKGNFDSVSVSEANTRIDALVGEGIVNFVVDLSDTLFLGSAAMAMLIALLKRVRALDGNARLVWPQRAAAQHVLKLTRLDRVFEMADTVDTALANF